MTNDKQQLALCARAQMETLAAVLLHRGADASQQIGTVFVYGFKLLYCIHVSQNTRAQKPLSLFFYVCLCTLSLSLSFCTDVAIAKQISLIDSYFK